MGYIAAALRSDLPVSVKTFVLIMLFLFVLLSFESLILILHILYSFGKGPVVVPFMPYFYVMSGQGLLGVFIGIPLVGRMTSLEETQRLEASFAVIQEVNSSRHRRKTSA